MSAGNGLKENTFSVWHTMKLVSLLVIAIQYFIGCSFQFSDSSAAIYRSNAFETAVEYLRRPNVFSVAPSLDQQLVVVPNINGITLSIQSSNGVPLHMKKLSSELVNCTWIGHSHLLLVCEFDRYYVPCLWDLANGRLTSLEEFKTKSSWIAPVYVEKGNKVYFFVSDLRDGYVREYDLSSGEIVDILGALHGRSDVAISADGSAVAGVSKDDRSKIRLYRKGIGITELGEHSAGRRVKELSLSADGALLAFTSRKFIEDDFYNATVVDIASNRSLSVINYKDCDVRYPKVLNSQTLVYQTATPSSCTLLKSQISLPGCPTVQLGVDLKPVKTSAYGHLICARLSEQAPSDFIALDSRTGSITHVFSLGNRGSRGTPQAIQPTVLITTNTSTLRPVHSIMWPPKLLPPAGVVLMVHGGPSLHTSTAYDESVALFNDWGFKVVAVNYAGSTGHGAKYEQFSDIEHQTEDVGSVIKALAEVHSCVIIVGHSYGGHIALLAGNKYLHLVSGVVLVSPSLGSIYSLSQETRNVSLVYGGKDKTEFKLAQKHLASIVPRKTFKRLTFSLIVDESHSFRTLRGKASIISAVMQCVKAARTTHSVQASREQK